MRVCWSRWSTGWCSSCERHRRHSLAKRALDVLDRKKVLGVVLNASRRPQGSGDGYATTTTPLGYPKSSRRGAMSAPVVDISFCWRDQRAYTYVGYPLVVWALAAAFGRDRKRRRRCRPLHRKSVATDVRVGPHRAHNEEDVIADRIAKRAGSRLSGRCNRDRGRVGRQHDRTVEIARQCATSACACSTSRAARQDGRAERGHPNTRWRRRAVVRRQHIDGTDVCAAGHEMVRRRGDRGGGWTADPPDPATGTNVDTSMAL